MSPTWQHSSYHAIALAHFTSFDGYLKGDTPKLDGNNLSIARVVSIARHGTRFEVNNAILNSLEKSHHALQDSITSGDVIYGVNTGFGGSAHTRTDKVDELQRGLLREFNSGIIVPSGYESDASSVQDLHCLNHMPVAWVRAGMLIRLNSLISGHSGVRRSIVERISQLLALDITPQIPIFGSVSASGDLAPASYIGNAIQGKPTVKVTVGALKGQRQVMTAQEAMHNAGLQPERVEAKEALAIMNGTGFSTAIAALAMHDAHGLAVLSQALTAMSVEALKGQSESFDPFFAKVRPHRGQQDAASTILGFLKGSKVINQPAAGGLGALKQDRYSIRTAAQWLGPVLEDLQLAHEQVTIECNSVTDNPLIDVSSTEPRHVHGGNFQARAITSAMEKTRLSIQSLGRMLFAQCTEIINPATNAGLPTNLVSDEPSESFIMKSVDVMVAALQSELGFLANPVGTHVQTAEQGNQALNSLALISGRYTLTSIDVLSKLVAAHLLVACQALDLRVMTKLFLQSAHDLLCVLAEDWHNEVNSACGARDESSADAISDLTASLWSTFRTLFDDTIIMNSAERFTYIADKLQPHLLSHLSHIANSSKSSVDISAISRLASAWSSKASTILRESYATTLSTYLADPTAESHLGLGARKMYSFIRQDLGVPFLNTAVLTGGKSDADMDAHTPSTGTFMTRIYLAVRDGRAYKPALQALEEVHAPRAKL